MTDPWNLTEAQRRQFREAQARASALCNRQQEITAEGPEVFYLQCVLEKHEPGTWHWDEADEIWFLHGSEKTAGPDRWQALGNWLQEQSGQEGDLADNPDADAEDIDAAMATGQAFWRVLRKMAELEAD